MELKKTGKVEKTGKVLSSKMDKSRIVLIESRVKHPFYKKFIRNRKKVMVHDESNISGEGDTVRIIQCRPISKRKRWTVREVIEKAINQNPSPESISGRVRGEGERGQNGASAVSSDGS